MSDKIKLTDQLKKDKNLFEQKFIYDDSVKLSKKDIKLLEQKIIKERQITDHLEEPYNEDTEIGGMWLVSECSPDRTGLPTKVLISCKGVAKHDIRIRMKLSNESYDGLGDTVIIGIIPIPHIISGNIPNNYKKAVFEWISLNRKMIIDHWSGESSSVDVVNEMIPLPRKNWLFEMANLFPKDTGLSRAIFVSENIGLRHGPRIKVSSVSGGKMVIQNATVVGILPKPRIIIGKLDLKDKQSIFEWIKINTPLLINLWNRQITQKEFIEQFKPYSSKNQNKT